MTDVLNSPGLTSSEPSITPPDCWRFKRKLLAVNNVWLPERCIKCNADHDITMATHDLEWKPWYYLLLGKVGAILPSRKLHITYGLCPTHRRQKLLFILAALATLCAGIGVLILSARIEKPIWSILGIALILAAAVIWSRDPGLKPVGIKGHMTSFGGAGKPFLDSLPTYNEDAPIAAIIGQPPIFLSASP